LLTWPVCDKVDFTRAVSIKDRVYSESLKCPFDGIKDGTFCICKPVEFPCSKNLYINYTRTME